MLQVIGVPAPPGSQLPSFPAAPAASRDPLLHTLTPAPVDTATSIAASPAAPLPAPNPAGSMARTPLTLVDALAHGKGVQLSHQLAHLFHEEHQQLRDGEGVGLVRTAQSQKAGGLSCLYTHTLEEEWQGVQPLQGLCSESVEGPI